MVVERIGERHPWPERGAQGAGLRGGERWQGNGMVKGGVGHQAGLAARARDRSHGIAGQGPREMQEFQGFQHLRQRGDLRDAEPRQERRRPRAAARERGGVRLRGGAGLIGAP